jgi:hypothetical protein
VHNCALQLTFLERLDSLTTLQFQCDEYQEQSYLLDPWLEKIVAPPVEALRKHATKIITENYKGEPSIRVSRLSLVIYQIIKTRGYKTIGR